TIAVTNGSIGYLTADLVVPVVPGGLRAANLQNRHDFFSSTNLFHPPTGANATAAMMTPAPSFTPLTRINPVNWSGQMLHPDPLDPAAYPISGFTMLELYQCYRVPAAVNALFSYLVFHYTNAAANAIIASQGFGAIPANWLTEVAALATVDRPIGAVGSGAC